ncbi:MAG: hypothetical protein CMO74_15880 [Verrucomicrobiales bacterium]|nr:hypothetical protein [Verrucomicrobiales bacterium]|tara:strand:+ start:1902 stop:2393 length:492 start_codon:yes stop_codon:yes gene_type:complete
MQGQSFDEVLDAILAEDPRYDRDAYHFVREGLDYTQQQILKQETEGKLRHVSGQELLGGLRAYALDQFGPMTLTVLTEWGVWRCEDFGEMVFNMVEHELLARTDEDSRDDFKDGYDFLEAFRKPFLPSAKPARPITALNRRGLRPASLKARHSSKPKSDQPQG